MNTFRTWVTVCAVVVGLVSAASAVNIETVPVGNPGNAGELSGVGAGGHGPDRICGAVDYWYRIGKYEVTAGQYTEFLNAVAMTDTYGLYNTNMSAGTESTCKIQRSGSSGNYTYAVASDYANRPVTYVSYWDSCRFANWLNNGQPTGAQGPGTTETGAYTLNGYNGIDGRTIQRNAGWKWAVTSEDEWYKAAYYKGGSTNAGYWDYPTRSDTAPGRDLADVSGNNANYRGWSGSSPYPIDSGKYTTVVGQFQNSPGPYGTFDQGGNLWEWTEALLYDFNRGLRGGAFNNYTLELLASDRADSLPVSEGGIGFRVAYVPEPGSAMLLLGGGLALARRRFRR